MIALNQRQVAGGSEPTKRRISILVDFPEERLESVIVQWENLRPSVLVQLKADPREPLQFPGKRPEIPGNADLPKDKPLAIDLPLQDFVDATSGQVFGRAAYLADILFSLRAFSALQPEPDLFLPAQSLWECRAEALRAMQIIDEPGFPKPQAPH